MALHKEPYGLVYNDDGSLCVTLRKDDTPFEGVTSFAVEEGTENLVCEALRYQSSTSAYGTCTKGATAGKTYALSGRVKVDADGHWFRIYLYKSGWGWSDYLEWNKTQYETKAKVITLPNDGGTYYMSFFAGPRNSGCTAYIDWLQVEQKPFATSFVDGSRTNGSLLLFDDATVRSWADNGIVIAGWWKFNYWSDDKHFRVFSCTESGGFNIEKFPNYDIRLAINDGGTYLHGYFQDPDVFADLDWHFVVFYYRPDTKVAKVYVDAVEQTSVTLSQGLHFNEDIYYSLVIGAELNNPQTVDLQASILVANLFIGKPLDKAGHLIWSAPYIQQLYQAKRPFSVPPKMPVI